MNRTGKTVIITVLMVYTLVYTSCNRANSSADGGVVDRNNFTELGTFPIVKEKETITVMTYDNGTNVFGDANRFTRYYEEKTNVKVNWIIVPLEQFKERVNLALAGGDKIDLIISGENSQANFTNTELMKLSEQKIILPIQDYIDQDTIYFKQRLDEQEGWRDLITLPDGNIYALPSLNGCYSCLYYGRMFVNLEFLKNVNLPIPTTTEEFRQMLLAFKTQDANGNGNPNDEVPFMGATDNFGCKVDTYLISAFIYDDGENRLFLDNGKVTAAYTQDEFRDGLRYLNQLFRDGLISKDSFTASRNVRAQLNSAKYESVIGAIPNMHNGNLGTRDMAQPVRWIDYESIAPLTGPKGYRVARYDPYEAFTIAGVLPATCKNPALVMRWLDWFMSDEGTLMLGYGDKEIGWTDPDPGATGTDGNPAKIKVIVIPPDHPEFGKITWGPRFPSYRSFEYRSSIQSAEDMRAPDGSGRDRYGEFNIKQMYVPYAQKVENLIPPLYYSPEHSLEMSTLVTTINTYVNESIAKFTVGDMNIETGWAAFQTNLKNLGLERYLQIIQTSYDNSAVAKKLKM
ncbi:ABC transporter substrate-binding protein [Spirochaetia bacterium]|nr:ABC transporter substrate-binding protein [Spirochaetia bacterium]